MFTLRSALLLLFPLFLSAQSGISPGEILYPADMNVINVKAMNGLSRHCANAQGNGADDTNSLQCAVQQAFTPPYQGVIYFPSGTYLTTKQLRWQTSGGAYSCCLALQGQSSATTTIRLADATFTNGSCDVNWYNGSPTSQCGSLLYTASSNNCCSEDGYNNHIRDLTLDLGAGNTGAIGLDWNCSNVASLRNVVIRGRGRVGLAISRSSGLGDGPGPCYVKNLGLTGTFDYAIVTGSPEVGVTFEHIGNPSCANTSGWWNHGASVLGARDIRITACAGRSALVNDVAGSSAGNFSLIDAVLTGAGGTVPAVNTAGAFLYARNVSSTGFSRAVSPVSGMSVAEYASTGATTLFSVASPASLNLPVNETPAFLNDNNFANWRSVGAPSGGDDTQAIQAAMNAGKATVYFPFGSYGCSGTISVPTGVRRILGTSGFVTSPGTCIFRFNATSGGAVEFRDLWFNSGSVSVENNQTVPLILADLHNIVRYSNVNGNGLATYMEDVAIPSNGVTLNGGNLWARQLDIEADGTKFDNRGGTMWVLGYKTEGVDRGPGTPPYGLGITENGGRTEIIGAYNSSNGGSGGLGYYVVDSSVSIAGANVGWGGFPSATAVNETRSGAAHTYGANCAGSCSAQRSGGVQMTLYTTGGSVVPPPPPPPPPPPVSSGAISINFTGSGTTVMGTAEVAGALLKANWNGAAGASGSIPLTDESGAATSATVQWKSDNTWNTPIPDTTGNNRMMRGYLDTGAGNPTTVTLAGLAPGTWTVYVYTDGDNQAITHAGTYQIGANAISAADAPNANFSGTFQQASNTNGNYVVFGAVNVVSGFTLTASPSGVRAPVNGIQIIPCKCAVQ